MTVPAKSHAPSPGQTVGPFFAFGLGYSAMNEIARPSAPDAVRLTGRVLDGAGAPVPDAVVEVWGADADGSIPRARGWLPRGDRGFTGFGRSMTTDEGRFEFWTREPGATEPGRARFFAAIVFARGLPDKLRTRIYLPDDPAALDGDPLLSSLDAGERATLIATRTPDGELHHDIRLQGERETVFLAF